MFQSPYHKGTLAELSCWWLDYYEDMAPSQRRAVLGTVLHRELTCADLAMSLVGSFYDCATQHGTAPPLM